MPSRVKLAVLLAVSAIAQLSHTAICHARQRFELVSIDDLTTVFATLDVLQLPASEPSHFGPLSFTSEGDSVFGFGVGEYAGEFESYLGEAVDLVDDALRVVSQEPAFPPPSVLVDSVDVPPSTIPREDDFAVFLLAFSGSRPFTGVLIAESANTSIVARVQGEWFLVVPEPTSTWLFVTLLPFFARTWAVGGGRRGRSR